MKREDMIIDFYEDGRLPKRVKIKIWWGMIKETIKNEFRHYSRMGKARPSTVSNNRDDDIRTN